MLTGEVAPVLGTFFDFSSEKPLGAAIDGVGGDPPGLDHCLVRVGTSDDGRSKVRSGYTHHAPATAKRSLGHILFSLVVGMRAVAVGARMIHEHAGGARVGRGVADRKSRLCSTLAPTVGAIH